MEWQIEYLPDSHIVAITTSGTMTMASLCEMVAAGAAAARHHDTKRVLVDHAQTISALTTIDIYRAPSREREMGAVSDTWVAVVSPTASPAADDNAFYENASANAGLVRRVFQDRGAAIAWLVTRPVPDRPPAQRRGEP